MPETPTLTPWPAAPAMTQDQATFDANAEATVAHFPVFGAEMTAIVAFITACLAQADADAAQAAAAATLAQDTAAAAAAGVNAPVWGPDEGYTQGQVVYSPLDFQSYRAKVSSVAAQQPIDGIRFILTANNGHSYTTVPRLQAFATVGGADLCTGGTASATSGTQVDSAFGPGVSSYQTANALPQTLTYMFATPVATIVRVSLTGYTAYYNVPTQSVRDMQIQVTSDGGSTWATVGQISGMTGWALDEVRDITIPGGDPSTDADNWAPLAPSAVWTRKQANFLAVAGNGYLINTSAGGFTMTLPATPLQGDTIPLKTCGTLGTVGKELTIDGNGKNVNDGSRLILDMNFISGDLVYDSTDGWRF